MGYYTSINEGLFNRFKKKPKTSSKLTSVPSIPSADKESGKLLDLVSDHYSEYKKIVNKCASKHHIPDRIITIYPVSKSSIVVGNDNLHFSMCAVDIDNEAFNIDNAMEFYDSCVDELNAYNKEHDMSCGDFYEKHGTIFMAVKLNDLKDSIKESVDFFSSISII